MARQTRQQRRARRAEQQTGGGDGKMVQRARARQAQVRPAAQPPKSQGGQRRTPGGGTRRFISESWGELKKVEWPGQAQVIQGTVVVLVACAVVGAFLYLNDTIWKQVVQKVFLGQ
jgi:preprotein translocase SecE subunit